MLKLWDKKKFSQIDLEILEIKKDIKECEQLLARNNVIFNMAIDESLIDAKIYERESLLRHYDYLVKLLKDKQGKSLENDEVMLGG